MMKITISVGGRFHAFNLAKHLQDQGYLKQLLTSYPKFEVKKYGIPPRNVRSIISKEIYTRGYKLLYGEYPNSYSSSEWYDLVASYRINFESDLYVIWSGFALRTIKRIRKYNPNSIIILERGSTHIKFQNDILKQAYSKAKIEDPRLSATRIISKEMREYEMTDYIAIPTHFVKKTFLKHGINNDKLLVNPYGVNLSDFNLKTVSVSKTQHDLINILFVGNFSVRKGAFNFLTIVEYYKGNPRVKFILVGGIEGPFRERVAEYIQSGNMAHYNTVPQKDLPKYYELGDLFLLPAYEEGMAMVLLQAMASGLPILASHNSGAGMAVTHGEEGFLFEPESVQQYIEAIDKFLTNPELIESMGMKARKKIESGFSWKNYGTRATQLYSKVLNN